MPRLFIVLFLTLSLPAFAEAPVIDMTTILRTDRGDPMKDPTDKTEDDATCANCRSLTLGRALAAALNAPEKNLTFEQLYTRGALIVRIKDNASAKLSADEVTLIEKCLAIAGFFPIMVIQITSIIDPNFKAGK